jgi:hypothetical protein
MERRRAPYYLTVSLNGTTVLSNYTALVRYLNSVISCISSPFFRYVCQIGI